VAARYGVGAQSITRQLAVDFALLAVCTENLIRVDDVMETPKLAE
jgi:hypothetical protein